ncbi:MAG: hypothetical protein OEV33_01615 [Armatimonadota bacterium]|nr:hypothetical protein [Armatimonadota bacterium]
MIAGGRLREVGSILAALACGVAFAPGSGYATPTGLNNIPTADVAPPGVLVCQAFAQFGEDRGPAWFAGFKYGPGENWEVGLDDTAAGAGSAGGPTLQAKYRVPLGENRALALGAANVSTERSRHGDALPYLVLSAPLSAVRGHFGYSWQSGNRAWFLGADGPVDAALTLRADWIQAADGEEHVSSLGFIRALSPRWLVEGWASFPSAEAAETSYVLKLNWVVPLG